MIILFTASNAGHSFVQKYTKFSEYESTQDSYKITYISKYMIREKNEKKLFVVIFRSKIHLKLKKIYRCSRKLSKLRKSLFRRVFKFKDNFVEKIQNWKSMNRYDKCITISRKYRCVFTIIVKMIFWNFTHGRWVGYIKK